MTQYAFTFFDTAIGRCAIVWGSRGITSVRLPESSEANTRRCMLARFPDARENLPPPDIAQARDGIIALLSGEGIDLSGVALDMAQVPPFHRRVYEAARAIAPGRTLTYGALARMIGMEGAARAVGQALGRNPFPILVPCHRVLAANGGLGGFSAHGGIATKRRLLEIEGPRPSSTLPLDGIGPRPPSSRRGKAKDKRRGKAAAILRPFH